MKELSFELLCVSFVNAYQFVCMLLSFFGFEGGMLDLVVFSPDHCLSFYYKQILCSLLQVVNFSTSSSSIYAEASLQRAEMGTDEVSLHKDLRASKSHNTEHDVKRVTAAIPVISYVDATLILWRCYRDRCGKSISQWKTSSNKTS